VFGSLLVAWWLHSVIYLGGKRNRGIGALDPATIAAGAQVASQLGNKLLDNLGQGWLQAFGLEDSPPPAPVIVQAPASSGPPWGLILGLGGGVALAMVLMRSK
jgi:hypothetical protein